MGGVTKPGGDAERGRRVGVGVRVSTRRTWGSGPVGDPGLRVAGVIIEDHSDIVADAGGVGRDWALPGRWAIALDDGFLVVRNTTNLRSTEAAWLSPERAERDSSAVDTGVPPWMCLDGPGAAPKSR